MDRLFAAFIEHYAAHIADRSRPFPQLEATLDRLAADGHRLAVCTNKLEWLSRLLLTKLKLTPYFAAICGQDTFGVMKPHPEILRQTILRAGGEPADAVMIGDSGTDVRTARAAASAGDRGRLRLQRSADRNLAAGPHHQFVRRLADGHCGCRGAAAVASEPTPINLNEPARPAAMMLPPVGRS